MDVGDMVAAAAGALFGGGGTAAIVTALTRRRLTRVEAADALADSAIQLLETVKRDSREDLTAMRAEIAESRREAAELRLNLRNASREAEQLASYLSRITYAIHDPNMTMDRLRALIVATPPGGASHIWLTPPA